MAPPCDRAALALPAPVGKPAALGTPLPLPAPRRRADGCGPMAADQPPPPCAARPWGLSAASRPKLCRLVEGRPLPGKLLMEVRACRVLPQALVPRSLLVILWRWRLRAWPGNWFQMWQLSKALFGVRSETFAAGWSQESGQAASQPPAAASTQAFLILIIATELSVLCPDCMYWYRDWYKSTVGSLSLKSI